MPLDLYGVGSGVTDISVPIDEADFSALSLPDFRESNIAARDFARIIATLESERRSGFEEVPGGSALNTVVGVRAIGGETAYSCKLGDDSRGRTYERFLAQLGIEFPAVFARDVASGVCLLFVPPHGERTCVASVGASALLSPDDVSPAMIRKSQWVLLEGHLAAQSDSAREALRFAARSARDAGLGHSVALSLSAVSVVKEQRSFLSDLAPSCDLIIANSAEACEFTECVTPEESLHVLRRIVPHAVITLGQAGVLYSSGVHTNLVPAKPAETVDTSGCGDGFAAGLFAALSRGFDFEVAVIAGTEIASAVLESPTARLPVPRYRSIWQNVQGVGT